MACLTTLYSLRRPAWSRSTGREGEATVTRAEEGDKKKRKRKEQKERTKKYTQSSEEDAVWVCFSGKWTIEESGWKSDFI